MQKSLSEIVVDARMAHRGEQAKKAAVIFNPLGEKAVSEVRQEVMDGTRQTVTGSLGGGIGAIPNGMLDRVSRSRANFN